MIMIIIVLLLITGLLSVLCFIYFRFRSNGRAAGTGKSKDNTSFSRPESTGVILKKGNHTIIKTRGLTDETPFFHDN